MKRVTLLMVSGLVAAVVIVASLSSCNFFGSMFGDDALPPDYAIGTSVFPTSGVSGESFSGSFVVVNGGGGDGGSAVAWRLFLSVDNVHDSADTEIASGVIARLVAGQQSDSVGFSGTWPTMDGPCYFIVTLQATDDADPGNNVLVSGEIQISPVPMIDYAPTNPGFPTGGYVGADFAGSFYISNVGGLDGSEDVSWTVYLSDDQNWGLDDTVLASGTEVAPAGGDRSARFDYLGTWPTAPDTYYIIIVIEAADDENPDNDELVSDAQPVTRVDYDATSVTFPTAATVGDPISGSFTVTNVGDGAGTADIVWALWISTDAALEAGDTEASSGVLQPLQGGVETAQIDFTGTWNVASGEYYLILSIQADDDGQTGNNQQVSGPVTVSAIPVTDYAITGETFPTEGIVSYEAAGEFRVQNLGNVAGSSVVGWEVLISEDEYLDTGDTVLQSGTTPALAGETLSPLIDYTGTWPTTPGTYYLFIEISATDEDTGYQDNNIAASGPAEVIEIADFSIVETIFPSTGATDESIGSGLGFRITNVGTISGSADVTWEVTLSDDATPSTDDTLLDSGATAPVLPGDSSSLIAYTGTWPSTDGTYYIIIVIDSVDDPAVDNNTAASQGVPVITAGTLVAVGSGGAVNVSRDGAMTWTAKPSGTTISLRRVASNGTGMWVAVGDSSTVIYSIDDGDTWSPASLPGTLPSGAFYGVTYGAGTWVAIGSTGSQIYSGDGINWNLATTVPPGYVYAVTYDAATSRFVAPGYFNWTQNGYYSTDGGVNWSTGGILTGRNGVGSDASGHLVSVGADGTTSYSDNGGNDWIAGAVVVGWNLYDVATDGTTWVACGGTNVATGGTMYSSDGGANWTATSVAMERDIAGITYDAVSGRFVGVASHGSAAAFYSTNAGFTWTRVDLTGAVADVLYDVEAE